MLPRAVACRRTDKPDRSTRCVLRRARRSNLSRPAAADRNVNVIPSSNSTHRMLRRFAGRVRFIEDLIAAYYCVMDPATPMRGAAFFLPLLPIHTSSAGPPLAWFQKIPGLGFTDDAAVPAAVFGLLRILLPSIARPPQEHSVRSFRERMGLPEAPNCRDPTRFMASAPWDSNSLQGACQPLK